MAHLTTFSFEFFYEFFREDASLLLLYHGAKNQKWPKTQLKRVLTSLKTGLIYLIICLKRSRKTDILMTLDKCDEPLQMAQTFEKPEAVGELYVPWHESELNHCPSKFHFWIQKFLFKKKKKKIEKTQTWCMMMVLNVNRTFYIDKIHDFPLVYLFSEWQMSGLSAPNSTDRFCKFWRSLSVMDLRTLTSNPGPHHHRIYDRREEVVDPVAMRAWVRGYAYTRA